MILWGVMMNKDDRGFTLVELAIVMIIIGLLIGGVLKGQQLIENAKVSATITQVKGYSAAYFAFADAYGAVPGDMANADTRLSGCGAGNSNNCSAGNGDSIVGTFTVNGQWNSNQNLLSMPQVETVLFWKHLALADLITGVDPTSALDASAWGESHPASPYSGGFHAMYFSPVQCTATSAANINCGGNAMSVRLQNVMNAAPISGTAGEQPVSPKTAASIDRKIDDGKPQRGSVQAEDGNGAGLNGCDAADYNEQITAKNCFMFFNIE